MTIFSEPSALSLYCLAYLPLVISVFRKLNMILFINEIFLENCFCFPDSPIYSNLGKGDHYGKISIYRPDFIIMHLYIIFFFKFLTEI